jgi:hypothetical protein
LDHYVSLPLDFLTSNSSFHILGSLMGFTSFVELFMVKALHKDLGTISNHPMFVDPHVTFAMLSLCYAQHLGYLLCTIFSSPNILTLH